MILSRYEISKEVKVLELEYLRRKLGMTQKELAALAGVQQNTVSQWEPGKRNPPSTALPLLASVLGCTIDELFGRSPPGDARDSA